MAMGKSRKGPLTPADWTAAAFRAIARGGVEAVAVEPIAAELGATKGSFYWHFKNRDALIDSALDEWERRLTDEVIESLEREPDPAQRLKKLLASAFRLSAMDRAAEVALLANPDQAAVRRRVRSVARRRVAYMATQLEALGWKSVDALDRAVLLSYIYVGYLQTAHVSPNLINTVARQRHVEVVFSSLIDAERVRL
jgi:AcrR family transcriptional regulator